MLSVELQLNGRPVAPGDLARRLNASITETAQRAIERQLTAIRCPEHHQIPRLVGTGQAGQLHVEGCCGQALERVKKQLKR
jgi:hypothetical protein